MVVQIAGRFKLSFVKEGHSQRNAAAINVLMALAWLSLSLWLACCENDDDDENKRPTHCSDLEKKKVFTLVVDKRGYEKKE